MPIDIEWEDGNANINILCDGCDKEYLIITDDISGLESCPFCGHYLETTDDDDETEDPEEDSWN